MGKLGLMAAAVIVVALPLSAQAGDVTGLVGKIDLAQGTIVVGDRLFVVSDETTAGISIEDLKEGDKVKIFYADSDGESGDRISAMQLDKIEEE